MTDRIKALYVVLDHDIREDDLQPTINAILQIKNVLDVTTKVSSLEDHVAQVRVKHELITKLFDVLREDNE